MNRASSARWATRLLGLGMILVAVLVMRVMERQLQRIGHSAERARERPAVAAPPLIPSTQLPVVRLPGEVEAAEAGKLDPKRGRPAPDPSRAAREEALPEPGRIPDGAIW